jgi:hypothetical protein
MVDVLCYLLAFVCFLAAALRVPVARVEVLALGLALAVFPLLVHAAQAVS